MSDDRIDPLLRAAFAPGSIDAAAMTEEIVSLIVSFAGAS